jgi:acyl-CoA thioesterase-2
VTYASDMTLPDAVLLGHGLAWDEDSVTGASLDHAMWFHGPFRAVSRGVVEMRASS